MNKIDISEWKDFRIGELLDILNGTGITKKEIYEHPGTLPAIQSGKENNGCIGYIDEEYCKSRNYRISEGMCLTVARSGSSGFVAFQSTKCVVGDSAKILQPKFNANRERLLFLRVLLLVNMSKYAYDDKVTYETYINDTIKLPVLSDGSPDWGYMENYIRKTEEKISNRIDLLGKEIPLHKIDCSKWQAYKIGDLFRVVKGTRLTKANMKQGDTNFIGASAANNGVTAKIGNTGNIHPANTITVTYNGSVGEAFYQTQEFWASDDVNVLYPMFNMNPSIALFFLPIIRRVGKQYAFIDKWEKETMEKDEILLPTKDNHPDWTYMEEYMRYIRNKAENFFAYAEHLSTNKEI